MFVLNFVITRNNNFVFSHPYLNIEKIFFFHTKFLLQFKGMFSGMSLMDTRNIWSVFFVINILETNNNY